MHLLQWVLLMFWWPMALAQPLPVHTRCGDLVLPTSAVSAASAASAAPTGDAWQSRADGLVPVTDRTQACWIRIPAFPQAGPDGTARWLSFSDLHVQRVTIELFDATGRRLGEARRLGASDHALVTGARAIFVADSAVQWPLYARFAPVQGTRAYPGFARLLRVESVEPTASLREEQREDLVHQSGAVFLLTTALLALAFGLALRDLNYAIYAGYAVFQALTLFTRSGLPFMLESQSPLWLNAWVFNYLVAVFSVLLNVRFGRFHEHSPRTARLAYGVAAAFLLVIPLHYVAPQWGSQVIYGLVPLHFLIILSGNWRGWRQGERGCGILLVGLTPIALYWLAFILYSLLLHQPMPSQLAIGSPFDFLRNLLLPLAFLVGISERTLRLQKESVRLARMDPVTGLRNRAGLRQLGQALWELGRRPSVLMLNIERFHAINEALGPVLGDQILRDTGGRLQKLAQAYPQASVGRMHADQFCLLLPDQVDMAGLRQVIETEFLRPAEVRGQAVDIAWAAGWASATPTSTSIAELMRNAEVALDAGRSLHQNWLAYRPDMERSQLADLDLLSELKRAVDQNELEIYLQPKVRLADGVVSSAEALVRWLHPQRGLIPPGVFVPFAEKTGRVTLLTRWVLQHAMQWTAARRLAGKPLQVSVNLSTCDLAEMGFAQRVAELARQTGAQPSDIRLEVTESNAMQDPVAAMQVMQDLRAQGFSLSIDDFGTGYSSLAYLQKMPVAELKIDRAFVRDVQPGSEGAALLDATIALGHRMGLSVVGEGAETAQEWALLRSLGCDYAQGWFAAQPMPLAEFDAWCQTNTPFLPPAAVPT
jgi:diguanylate cyclase (GGDEF)-like protein